MNIKKLTTYKALIAGGILVLSSPSFANDDCGESPSICAGKAMSGEMSEYIREMKEWEKMRAWQAQKQPELDGKERVIFDDMPQDFEFDITDIGNP